MARRGSVCELVSEVSEKHLICFRQQQKKKKKKKKSEINTSAKHSLPKGLLQEQIQ
jgi:hypothetical protein